jgi:hypothetical protein
MDSRDEETTKRRPFVVNHHQKRSVYTWLVPLVIILAIIIFLPRVMDLLD